MNFPKTGIVSVALYCVAIILSCFRDVLPAYFGWIALILLLAAVVILPIAYLLINAIDWDFVATPLDKILDKVFSVENARCIPMSVSFSEDGSISEVRPFDLYPGFEHFYLMSECRRFNDAVFSLNEKEAIAILQSAKH